MPSGVRRRAFPSASKGVEDAQKFVATPQTLSPSYRLAFADKEYLLRDEMRGVRLQLEFQKADLLQQEHGIESTIVVFGGSRIPEPGNAEQRLRDVRSRLEADPGNAELLGELGVAERLVEKSRYYEEARELGRLVSSTCQTNHQCDFVVTTGGGPGIMEAANRGAHDVQAKNIGLNIVLPHEQQPNSFITPDLCFQFHYFALRKMHFLMRAKALVCFPGGFGTLDELFEALTLIQTKKVDPIPVLLVGEKFWKRLIDFEFLAEEGTIGKKDLDIFQIVESAHEAWQRICEFYKIEQSPEDA